MADRRRCFPLHQGLRFLDAAARSESIEDLGLIVGRRTRITELTDLGRLLSHLLSPAMTLGQAITLLVEAIPFFSSWQRLSLRCCGEKVCFTHRLAHSSHRHLRCVHPEADDRRRTPGRWTVVFDGSLLNERLRYCAPNAHAADAMHALRRAAPADDFAGSLRQVIGSLLPAGSSGLAAAAEAAGLSARTLQRRLNASGCTYSELLEDARRQAALRLLRDKKIKILDIALELGYSDPANFTRAFRKWTGASPRTARRGGSAG